MGIIELVVVAVGLAMDAFAVAVCKGLASPKINYRQTGLIALFFGGFQALMPVIGWALGKQFEKYITNIDHWIAFVLLAFIGGKMIWEAAKGGDEPEEDCGCGKMDLRELTVLSIATSIDALAVGITFAFLKTDIVLSATLIGVITAALSALGVFIGNRFGARFKKKAEIAGGAVLVIIGLKILLEHLGIIG